MLDKVNVSNIHVMFSELFEVMYRWKFKQIIYSKWI